MSISHRLFCRSECAPTRPLSDVDLMRFSRQNRPLQIEREQNGDILIMTPAGNNTGKMNQRLGRLLDGWAEQDGRGVTFDFDTGFRLPSGAIRSSNASWLVDPRSRSVTVYRTAHPPEKHTDPTSVQGDGPIRGFELVLSRLWG